MPTHRLHPGPSPGWQPECVETVAGPLADVWIGKLQSI
jgi:hypothetical protein